MKKTTPIVIFILLAIASKSQISLDRIHPWGVWGIGSIKNANSLNIYDPYNIQGYQIYYNWSDLERTRGTFDWTELDNQMSIVANKNMWIAVEILVGPNCPEWIYINVPRVFTTGGNNDGPYPYYFNPNYKSRYYNLLREAAEHFNNLSGNLKSHFLYWQITEGSTGDEDAYKGTPVEPQYEINYNDWEDFRHAAWDSVAKYAGPDRQYKFLFNTGNFAQDLQYVDAKFHGDFHKDGLLSHQYSFDGEMLYYLRQYRELNETAYDNRTRGEVQDIFNKYWWSFAPVKQAFALICSAASGGLDIMNITPGYINSIANDTRATDFYQKYGGERDPSASRSGFIALRDVPDFADSLRFPESVYGPVIDPAQQSLYDQKVKNIWSNKYDSSVRKYWRTMQAIVQFINPRRVDRIVDEFKSAGAMYSTEDEYHNDFGINMTIDYNRFIRQWYPDSSSYGAWRIGPDSSIYGRYSRLFRLKQGKGAMYFRFNDMLVKKDEKVQVTVTYYDSGNGAWSMNCSEKSLRVQNTNTGQWLQKTLTIDAFIPRTVYQGKADLALRYVDGSNTPFTLIQVDALSVLPGAKQTDRARLELDVKVSPNPNVGQFIVSFISKNKEQYAVYITDAAGGLYYADKRIATTGLNVWKLSPGLIRKGSYILHIESPTAVAATKFIVIK